MVIAKPAAVALLVSATLLSNSAQINGESEELLAKMRNAYATVRTAEFQTVSVFGNRTFKNKVRYKAGMGLRVDDRQYQNGKPKSSVEVLIGRDDYQWLPPGAVPKTFDVGNLYRSLGPSANLETLNFTQWNLQLSTDPQHNMHRSVLKVLHDQTWNGRKWTVLVEEAPAQRVVCRYYIDPATFLMWRTQQHSTNQSAVDQDVQIVDLKLDRPIDNSVFQRKSEPNTAHGRPK